MFIVTVALENEFYTRETVCATWAAAARYALLVDREYIVWIVKA